MFLASPVLAQGKSFFMDRAGVAVDLRDDGSVQVTEDLTFAFSGQFQGAFRDIPLRAGESIREVSVSEAGIPFVSGANTELGSTDEPGRYGVEDRGSVIRIVWHYRADSEPRTFRVSYVMDGLAKVYDDVVDVNLQVWGDQWDVTLSTLEATFTFPGSVDRSEVRVWGHPADINGFTSLGRDGITPRLEATNVSERRFVEMRVVLPTSVLTTTTGATRVSGVGLEDILAEEAAEVERAADRQSSLGWVLILLGALGSVTPLALLFGYFRHGTEPRIKYDREYEQEPPDETPPALVAALARQGDADERGFTATIFDLLRRGAFKAEVTSVEKKTWLGLRREQITDLAVKMGDQSLANGTTDTQVAQVVKRIVSDGPVVLTDFRKKLRENPSANHTDYMQFRNDVRRRLVARKLIDNSGRNWAVWVAIGGAALAGAIAFGVPALFESRLSETSRIVLTVGALVVGALGVGFSIAARAFTKPWVRRTPAGALLNARWAAFGRYLRDFSRLEDAPPAALGIWEGYLVYGIALGVANDVLEAARLHAPPELENQSSLYWYGNNGYTGGHTSNAITGIESALSGAFAAPSSSGGGGGGAW